MMWPSVITLQQPAPERRRLSLPPEALADYPDLLRIEHLQGLTGLSAQTLRKEINEGRLPGCKIGRRLYVPKSLLLGYIEGGGGMETVHPVAEMESARSCHQP